MYDQHRVLALIPARGGSKGVPGKNIKELGGRPLIAYTIVAALGSRYVDDVVVTTDDERIAKVAKDFGARVPFMRPAEFALDSSATIECVVHARDELLRQGERYDCLVLLQPTSPLRDSDDIDEAIEVFVGHGCEGVVSVSPAEQNPILIRSKDAWGRLSPLLNTSSTVRRQDMPEYYCVNGSIYVNRIDDLSLDTSLNDNPIGYVMRGACAIDIDTIEDFKEAERIIQGSRSIGESTKCQ